MQHILFITLIGALGGAVLGFAGLGLRRYLRAASMAMRAHESAMHFIAQDTLDVPRRCAAFALCSAGHSAQASNIIYGRMRGLPVREFDFRYEVGHGTRRATRHYRVVLVEESAGARVLMWNRLDAASAPPAARLHENDEVGDWTVHGDADAAGRLVAPCAAIAPAGASVEVRAEGLMVCFPAGRPGGAPASPLQAAAGLIDALWPAGRAETGGEKGVAQAVANPSRP